MPIRSNAVGLTMAVLTTLGGSCAEPTRTSDAAPQSPATGIDRPGSAPSDAYETFDVVWSTIDERHFDPTHNGVDWAEIRTTYRPRIEDTRSQEDVQILLSQMIAELGQSHFQIIPAPRRSTTRKPDDTDAPPTTTTGDAETAENVAIEMEEDEDIVTTAEGYTGIRLDLSGDEIVVSHVERGSPAEQAGVEPGWRVASIDDRDPSVRLRSVIDAAREADSHMANYYLYAGLNAMASGLPGDTRRFAFDDGDEETIDVEVEVASKTGDTTDFMQLGPMTTKFSSRILSQDELRSLGCVPKDGVEPRILLITFDNWMFPIMGPLRTTMDEHRDADGIVIDLRGNPGGVGGLAMGVAGLFLDEPLSLGEMKMRDSTMNFRVNPQKVTLDGRLVEPFAKPLVILVDQGSASTSEIFAGGMQKLGRASVVGRRTAGAALPAHLVKLPNGDRFMYAVADFLAPDGNTIEGVGVPPDRPVPIDRDALSVRRDPDLATAVDLILEERTD